MINVTDNAQQPVIDSTKQRDAVDTNVCLDYATGIYGSHGIFVNLGEMF